MGMTVRDVKGWPGQRGVTETHLCHGDTHLENMETHPPACAQALQS